MKPLGTFKRKFYCYVLKELFLFFFLSLIVFTFVLVLANLGKMADFVINKGVDLKDILLLIVYSSPPMLIFTMPMSFLLSAVLVMGRLTAENEILALKASGINLKHLFVPVASLGIAVLVIAFLNTTLAIGESAKARTQILVNIIKKGVSFQDREGVFNDSIRGIVIYIDKVNAQNDTLKGIIISDDREEGNGIKQTFSAETGLINFDNTTFDLTFQLRNGSAQRLDKKADTFTTLSFKDHVISMNLKQILGVKSELRKKRSEMTIGELKRLHAIEDDPEKQYEISLEIPKRYSIPCSIVAFALLAVPLGIRRKSEGRFSGVVYSLLIFICYYVILAIVDNIGRTYQLLPVLVSFTPNVLFSLFGLFLMKDLNTEDRTSPLDRLKYRWEPHFAKAK